jgi:hypothetical protein
MRHLSYNCLFLWAKLIIKRCFMAMEGLQAVYDVAGGNSNNSTLGGFGAGLLGGVLGEAVLNGGFGVNRGDSVATLSNIERTVIDSGAQNAAYNNALTTELANQFAGVRESVSANTFATQAGFKDVQLEMARCCCETQKAIAAEGSATRALLQQLNKEDLNRMICDKDAKISQLEANMYTNAALAAQSENLIKHMAAISATAIATSTK